MAEISKEKREWMETIGMKEFKEPMKYFIGTNAVYSEDYIQNTPLEVLMEKYCARLIRDGELNCNDEERRKSTECESMDFVKVSDKVMTALRRETLRR